MGSLLVRQLSLQVTWTNFTIPSTGHELPTGSFSPAPPGSGAVTAVVPVTAPLLGFTNSLLASNKALRPTHLQRAQTGKPGSPLQADRASAEQHTTGSQLELPPSPTTETQVWDSHPNRVQKQSAGFHRSQSFEARPRTCTSEQIKTCAAGTLRSNPFLQQSRCFGGNAAAPTASGLPQPAPGETPLPKHHWVQAATTIRECRKKEAKSWKVWTFSHGMEGSSHPLPIGRIISRSFFKHK